MKNIKDKKPFEDAEFWIDVVLNALFFIGAVGWISLGVWQLFKN